MAECRRSATMSADVGGDGVTRPLARSGWRRCSGAGMASVEDEVRRADPLSVNPGQRVRGERMRRDAPQGGAAVDALPGCAIGGASAAHQRRLLCPRRCRGLTESVTARAVGQRRGGSSASAMRCRAAVRSAGRSRGRAAVYLVARGGFIRKMWSVARVNDVYSHR